MTRAQHDLLMSIYHTSPIICEHYRAQKGLLMSIYHMSVNTHEDYLACITHVLEATDKFYYLRHAEEHKYDCKLVQYVANL